MARRCEICKLDITDEYSWQGHIQGKRHLKNAQQHELANSIIQRSIFVTRIPYNVPPRNVIEFFGKFGEILKHRFGNHHLIIEYKNKEPVDHLLKTPVRYNGFKLTIRPRVINDYRASPKKANKCPAPEGINGTKDLSYDNVKAIFEVDSTFDDQLAAFLDRVAISDSEIETRYKPTCKTLDNIFQYVFPKCKTYRFGSTVTGLGFKNCDLDIYMDIGIPISQENNKNPGPNHISTAVVFAEVKRILYSKTAMFSKVVPIPKAKTPIIKFFYKPSEISCDISFKNNLAVHNSQLIKFYLSMDSNLWPTMMVLKYWVCNFELAGGDKMSKYALTMLFIFYLQQPSVNIVPSIIDLKRRCVPQLVEGWQVNFDANHKNSQESGSEREKKSIPELLHGFFDFYASFNFKINIVCPLDGVSHCRTLFDKPENLPDSMDRYKDYLKKKENPIPLSTTRPMCVQDPNELNHNLTGGLCLKYVENFQKYCEGVRDICISAAGDGYKKLLPSLFSFVIKNETQTTDISFIYYADNLLKTGLPDDFAESGADNVDQESFIKDHWFELVLKLIIKIFEEVYKFSVKLINNDRELKQQKIETQSDVHTNDQEKIVIHCTGRDCLWRSRNKVKKANLLDPSISLLEKEILISEMKLAEMQSQSKEDEKQSKIDFECHILKKGTKNPHMILTLTNNSTITRKFFSELALNIKDKMPHILNKTLIHMQQFKKETID